MPVYSRHDVKERKPPGAVALTDAALRQLREYVTRISEQYQ